MELIHTLLQLRVVHEGSTSERPLRMLWATTIFIRATHLEKMMKTFHLRIGKIFVHGLDDVLDLLVI